MSIGKLLTGSTVRCAVHHAPLVVLGRPCLWCMQAYKYIQRPSSTPMPGSKTVELHEPRASLHTTSGAPVSQGGRAKHSLFPPFPQVWCCCSSVHLTDSFCSCCICHSLFCLCHACCPLKFQDLKFHPTVFPSQAFISAFCFVTSYRVTAMQRHENCSDATLW